MQQQTEASTFQFLLGWVLLLIILFFINKSRLGHVIIYYSLLLLILFLIVVEYKQIAPILASVETIGQFNAGPGATAPTAKNQNKAGNI